MRSTACCRKQYLVRWLSVVACWLNGYGLGLGLGLGPGNALGVFFPLVYKCGEHLSSLARYAVSVSARDGLLVDIQ